MNSTRVAGFLAAAGLVLFAGFQAASPIPTGIVGMTGRTGGVGCPCHYYEASPDSVVRVWISGPDSVRAGTVATYTLRVAKRRSVAAGFNAAAMNGRLIVAESLYTQLLPAGDDTLELTHTWPRSAGGRDTIAWTFRYRAPLRPGTFDTLFAVGNSVNGDTLSNEADRWAFARSFPVRVLAATSVAGEEVPAALQLRQNFPNPFNPSTTVGFELPRAGRVRITLFDAAGRSVAVIAEGEYAGGYHEVVFRAGGLASGIYFYRLEFGFQSLVRKMLLLR